LLPRPPPTPAAGSDLRAGEHERREAIRRRLRTWGWQSLEEGRLSATAYDRARAGISRDDQRALDEAEREVVLNALSFSEFSRLAEFLPWLRSWHLPMARDAWQKPVSLASTLLALSVCR
jgi:hypothetical protein